jgi:hypothetical protein
MIAILSKNSDGIDWDGSWNLEPATCSEKKRRKDGALLKNKDNKCVMRDGLSCG